MTTRHPIPRLDQFGFRLPIQTRWSDNDMFGHVNNVLYYRFFEMVVADFLINPCAMDLFQGTVRTFAAESLCRFRKPLSWPQPLVGGLKIDHLGKSSVRYGLALFAEGEDDAAADGHWVHVFVDRDTQRPVDIPPAIRAVFERY